MLHSVRMVRPVRETLSDVPDGDDADDLGKFIRPFMPIWQLGESPQDCKDQISGDSWRTSFAENKSGQLP